MKRKFISILLSMTMILMSGCASSEKPATDGYTAGEYTTTAKGHNGDVVLKTTFSESEITAIEVLEHQESAGICEAPLENIPNMILEHQSLKVDTISGATVTSNAVLSAIESAVTEAGGNVDALKNVEINLTAGEKVEKTADVIIVGGGGAGLTAAVSAAGEGASVVVIEKTPSLGGNTVRTAGYYSAPVTDIVAQHTMNESQMADIERLLALEPVDERMAGWQETVKQDLIEYEANGSTHVYDSNAFTCLQYKDRFGAGVSTELLEHMIDLSVPVYEWLAEEHGMEWNEESKSILGDNWPRWHNLPEYKSGAGFIEELITSIEEKNLDIEIITEVAGESLILDNDKVIGVVAKAADGTEYQLNANNGVILATGGFAANPELREKYNTKWDYVGEELPSTNSKAMQGDGLLMALELGADVIDIDHYQFMPLADETGDPHGLIGDSQGLFVNKEGKRFVAETADRTVICNAVMNQTDKGMFIITSKEGMGIDENGYNDFGAHIDNLLEKGVVIKADTLEELASKMGVPADAFVQTVAEFNEIVLTQNDHQFGKTTFRDHTIISEEGPYYASWKKPAVHITKGGILVNTQEQVVKTDGQIIQGLYAAGEVTGGRGASGILEAFTTGYNAGKAAAQN